MSFGAVVRRIAFVVIVQAVPFAAFAQTSGVGAISGTIQDNSGGVLPGVAVELTNPGTVGGNQSAVTDERGVYQFARLVPGLYSVHAELQGFTSVLHNDITVNADVTARVDFTLGVGTVSEQITVTAQAQLLDTTTALHQTVLDKDLIQSLPSRNDLWNIAKTVPGLVLNKVNVGGSEAYSQSNATVHGAAQSNEGAFTIDGFEFGSAQNAGASLAMYIAPSTFQEVNYQTGNASAESQRGGLVYNMVTRTGSNTFRADANFSGAVGAMQSENVTDALRTDFLAALPARVLAANPDFSPSGKIEDLYDAAFAVTGPQSRPPLVCRDHRARVTESAEDRQLQPGWLALRRSKPEEGRDAQSVASGDQQAATVPSSTRKTRRLPITFRANTFSTESATQQQNPNLKRFEIVKWNNTVTNWMLLEAGGSWFHGDNTYQPQEGVGPGKLPTFDSVTQAVLGRLLLVCGRNRTSEAWRSRI